MTVIIAAFNFCSIGKDKTPYGASCLLTAFRHGMDGTRRASDDKIFPCIFDMASSHLSADDVAKRILQEVSDKRCDVLAFSAFVWADDLVRQAGRIIRRECPRLLIIVGGPMVAAATEEIASGYSWSAHEAYPYLRPLHLFLWREGVCQFATLPR